MTRHSGETWLLSVQLPDGLDNPGRYMAAVLKCLGRRFDVRCISLQEPAEIRRLQAIIDGLTARVAAQAELLARAAERRRDTG